MFTAIHTKSNFYKRFGAIASLKFRDFKMGTLNNISSIIGLEDQPGPVAGFEQSYFSLRQYEQRIHTDQQLLALPDVPKQHLYHSEWRIRKQSCGRLITYLRKKKNPLKVLEVGCGNAWLSAKIAAITGTDVMGIDPNTEEIKQARRVFKHNNLHLAAMDFAGSDLKEQEFDIILFAAAIQYCPSMSEVIAKAQNYLAKEGEIHILDTHLYASSEVAAAKKRTITYFTEMGFPKMAGFYFHHQLKELNGLNYRVMYNPNSWLNRLVFKSPFYWIRIKAN
jgi:ubiquinone/menaquinone biosynthesis C-methylase UbiE